jgi:hypothetical protein
MRKPPAIGKWIKEGFISTDIQLIPPDRDLSEDQEKKLKEESRLEFIDTIPFIKTQVVYTGFEIIDILSFDDATGDFVADFYLWFRWNAKNKGITKEDIESFEFTNGREITRVNLNTPHKSNKEKDRCKDTSNQKESYENTDYMVFRVTGEFRTNIDLHEYPFDTQVLKIELRHRHLTKDKLIYVRDNIAINKDTLPKLPCSWEFREKSRQYPGSRRLETSLGDPDYLHSRRAIAWATFGYALPLKRDHTPVFIKLIIPLVIIVSAAFISFWLAPQSLSTRTAIAISTLLAAIVLHLTQNLPNVGYVVTADKFFFLAYFMIFASLAESTTVHSLSERKKLGAAKRMDTWFRYASPVLFIIGFLVLRYSAL